MNDFLLSSLVIVGFTLLLVSGIRKLIPGKDGSAIQGGWLVLLVGTAVGVGLSFLAAYLELLIAGTAMLAWWALVVRGSLAAAAAFGYANWKQWVLAQLPPTPTPVPAPIEKPLPADGYRKPAALMSEDTPTTVPDLMLPPPKK